MEPSFAEPDPALSPSMSEAIRIDPEVGAALLLSGNYSRSLCDRVFSTLSEEEIIRLGQGMVRLKATPEDRLERMWNGLTLLFTGDWREEDDLVEFIRSVLRKGVREEPILTPVQKLAMLLLSLPGEVNTRITSTILSGLNRSGTAELTREMAHLLHYPGVELHERVVGEFLAFCRKQAAVSTLCMGTTVMEMEVERYAHLDPEAVADVVRQLWLSDAEPMASFHEAARSQPERMTEMLGRFAYGPATYLYVPPLEKAATFRACLSPEAAGLVDDVLVLAERTLPEPFVVPARKDLVLREFLGRFYLEYAKLIPIVLQ